MDKNKDLKQNFNCNFFKKIKNIYFPIIVTILIIFNISIIHSSLSSNTNFRFQPAASSGEAYFFNDSNFKKERNRSNSADINITVWVISLMLLVIFGIIYFVFKFIDDDDGTNEQSKADYIELLKDDSDYEGNI